MKSRVFATAFTVGAALVFAMGCQTGGGEQNYRILEEDQPMYEEGRFGRTPEAAPLSETAQWFASLDRHSELERSLDGLSREDWQRVVIEPTSGRVYHQPTYFADISGFEPQRQDQQTLDVKLQMQRAMSDDTYDLLSPARPVELLTQPTKAALDVVMLPVRMVITPPWATVATPPLPKTR